MTVWERYLQPTHKPNAKPISQLYALANEELLKPAPAVRLKTLPKFDQMTGGFRPFEYSIFCGSPGSGKTTMAAHWSYDFSLQAIPHFVVSVETGATDYVKRVMSAHLGRDINHGDAVEVATLKALHANHGHHFEGSHLWLSLYDNRIAVEILMADIAYMVKHHGIKVAIVDNFSFFLDATSAQNEFKEQDRVTHELIMFCKRIPVHIIMVMHPKKTETGRIEMMEDIRGSMSANNEAHNIFLWNRPHPDLVTSGLASPSDRELLFAKMRRRGKYVTKRLIFKCPSGVRFEEGGVVS